MSIENLIKYKFCINFSKKLSIYNLNNKFTK